MTVRGRREGNATPVVVGGHGYVRAARGKVGEPWMSSCTREGLGSAAGWGVFLGRLGLPTASCPQGHQFAPQSNPMGKTAVAFASSPRAVAGAVVPTGERWQEACRVRWKSGGWRNDMKLTCGSNTHGYFSKCEDGKCDDDGMNSMLKF